MRIKFVISRDAALGNWPKYRVSKKQALARRRAGSRSVGTCGRNSHEMTDGLVRGQVFVGIELHREPATLTRLGSGGAQHPPAAPNRHVFGQGNLGRHGKSQFHDRSERECRLGVKENSTATQVLRKTVHSPSFEMNRQRHLHFKTLRASAFNATGICAHSYILPRSGSLESVDLNSIANRTRAEVPSRGPLWKSKAKPTTETRRHGEKLFHILIVELQLLYEPRNHELALLRVSVSPCLCGEVRVCRLPSSERCEKV